MLTYVYCLSIMAHNEAVRTLTVMPGSDGEYAPGRAIFGGLALPPLAIFTWAQPM